MKIMTELKRKVGLFSATMLVVGNMIGIGIFVTAGRIYAVLPHPGYVVMAWVIGGLLSLAGGLAYAELASRFPRAGGGYVFLKESFGPFWGFLAGFSASLVTLPGTAAFLAMGFAKYAGITDVFVAKGLGILFILIISYINYRGVLRGAVLQDGFMVLKLALIALLIGAGFLSANGSFSHFSETLPLPHPFLSALFLALVPIMYTYSGWDATVYVAGEIKNPRKTLPYSMAFGAFLVMAVYLTLTMLYLYAVPVDSPLNKSVIVTSASTVLFGAAIGKFIGGLVAVSVLGCLSATILTAPRVIYAMAKDGDLPAFAGKVHPHFFTPANAIWLHAGWACLLLLTGTFDRLLDYVTVPSVLFAAVNVIGLFVVRSKNRSDKGAEVYRMHGYPVVPALFVLIMLWIVGNTAIRTPQDSLWGLAIVALGIPVYFVWRRVWHLPYPIAAESALVTIPALLCRNERVFRCLPAALTALETMSAAARKEGVELVVISAHRTLDDQKALFEDAERRYGRGKGSRWVAPPGHSEHHTGYVLDLADKHHPETDDEPGFEDTPAGKWLLANGTRFGFELSFPKGNWQGVGFEPWHWRFCGDAASRQVFHPGVAGMVGRLLRSLLN